MAKKRVRLPGTKEERLLAVLRGLTTEERVRFLVAYAKRIYDRRHGNGRDAPHEEAEAPTVGDLPEDGLR